MGCVSSRLEEEEEVVTICRERKKLMKLAVERRYILANAHCKYCHSLYAVSAAIKLFVARHKNPCSPFLITFDSPNCPSSPQGTETIITNPMFLQQNPCQPTKVTETKSQETQAKVLPCCESPVSSSTSNSTMTSLDETGQKEGYYYYMGMVSSPQSDFGWDFFNPFSSEVVNGVGFRRNSDDDLRAVREEEGIPDLEEEETVGNEEKGQVFEHENEHCQGQISVQNNGVDNLDSAKLSLGQKQGVEEKGLKVIDTPVRGRELLEALSDIEDHFLRAYESGKQVSRMLEANKMHMVSGFEEIKENSTKLIHQAITWHRSNTARSSSCKSLVASSSKNSTKWTEYKNDLFDDFGGMVSGSHALTLGRLYAWEKKLYEEVKEGDNIRKLYERKCARLRSKDIKGEDTISVDKTRAAVKDLYSRILVAIRQAESISEKIQKLRDDELQPQIIELLQGLTESWKAMMELHETQNHIIFEVKTYDCPTYGKFCNDSHRLATLQLEAEIQNWRECFMEYIAAQRLYVEALHGWLSKFVVPEVEFGSRAKRLTTPPYRANGPPLYMICRDWLTLMENLPDKAVSVAMRSFARDVKVLWVQQGEEKEQKRKVDRMAKELEKKTVAYHKVVDGFNEIKLLEYKPPDDDNTLHGELDTQNSDGIQPQTDLMSEKKDTLDNFKRRLVLEKEKHHSSMQETQRITLNGFQTGFSLIFDALVHFSKTSLKMYNDLANNSQNLEGGGEPTSQQQGSNVTRDLRGLKL